MPGRHGRSVRPRAVTRAPAHRPARRLYARRVSDAILRAHAWVLDHWPESPRRWFAVIAAAVAIVVGTLAALRPLGVLVHDLDPIAYVGLAVACWIGAGGALVPIPGVRQVSWLMIVHQSAALDPLIVVPVAAAAMALGQTSFYAAARAGAHRARRDRDDRTDSASEPSGPGEAGTRHAWSARLGALRRGIAAHIPAWVGRWTDRAKDAIARLMRTHPMRAIFLVSLVPTTLTTFASATAGAMGIGFRTFIAASLGGFLVLSTVLAVLGQAILAALGIQAR